MAIGPLEAKYKVCLYSVIIIISDSIQYSSVAVVIIVVVLIVVAAAVTLLLRTHKTLDRVHCVFLHCYGFSILHVC